MRSLDYLRDLRRPWCSARLLPPSAQEDADSSAGAPTRISQQLAEAAKAAGMTVEAMTAIVDKYHAEQRAEFEAAQRAETARADMEAAKAKMTYLAAAADGWVEAALASTCARVSNKAARYRALHRLGGADCFAAARRRARRSTPLSHSLRISRTAASEAQLTTCPRARFGARGCKSCDWSRSIGVQTRYAGFIRTTSGSLMLIITDTPWALKKTRRESYGRQLAAQCDDDVARAGFHQIYDDLSAKDAAIKEWFRASRRFKRSRPTKESFHNRQDPAFHGEPTVASLMEAVAVVDGVRVVPRRHAPRVDFDWGEYVGSSAI